MEVFVVAMASTNHCKPGLMASTTTHCDPGLMAFYPRGSRICVPEDKYEPPAIGIQLPTFTDKAEFGAAMKQKHFLIDKSWTYLNHGAYGAAIKEAVDASYAWGTYCESQPSKFLDREVILHIEHVMRRLAKFVDADITDLVLVPNATTGTSSVLQSLAVNFKPGESVFTINLAFEGVKKQVAHYFGQRGIRVDEGIIKFPIQSKDEIVKQVRDALKPDTRLAVFDHIPSSEGIVMPIKELVELCHSRGIQVLVDGAHCLGSMPISMKDIGADFYVSNAHKWLCSLKGSSFLYVAKQHQHLIQPLAISYGHGEGFLLNFTITGTQDYMPFLTLDTVMDFWEFYGVDTIRTYIYGIAKAAGQLLVDAWGTNLLADPALFGSMVTVALPEGLPVRDTPDSTAPYTYTEAVVLQNLLIHNAKIEVPIKVVQGKLYVRVSAHVYNELADYQVLADAVLQILQNTAQQCQ